MRSRDQVGTRAPALESQAAKHTFVEGPPLLLRGDMDASRLYDKLGAALEELGLACELTLQGLRIEPLSGTSARTN
jgi:hypothetical protein